MAGGGGGFARGADAQDPVGDFRPDHRRFELHARYDVGGGRDRPAVEPGEAGEQHAGDGDDGVEQLRYRGGGDAAGRVRLHSEARGQPSAGGGNLQASFRNQAPGALLRPATVLGTVNRHFFESTAAERFATLFFGIYDDSSRRIRYVNCAHVSPLLLRASGELVKLDATATMLGAFQVWQCKEASIELNRGDTLLLYSDGVTEAGIEHGDEFGDERLERVLRESAGLPAN